MWGLHAKQRILLEKSRRFRRWLAFGVALPTGYLAKLTAPRPKRGWKEITKPPGRGFWSRSHRASRLLIEPAAPVTPAPPGCIQGGNAAGFPLGQPLSSAPAYVHWLPSVIYHGLHGAIMDLDGSFDTELLDGSAESLDISQTKSRPLPLNGRVMALSCSKNYFHWLLKMLPRLDLLERSEGSLEGIDTFLINKPTWQQEQVYRGLGLWDRCAVIDRKTCAACRMLAAPSLMHGAPEWACRYVRKKLGRCELPAIPLERKIYVVRGNAIHRSLVNEREVCLLLESYGFEIVDCSNLSVAEQASLFASSAVIVGVHGAALSNLVFCKPGAVVLEIFGSAENQKVYWLISHHMRLRYHYLMAGAVNSGSGGNSADIIVEVDMLARSIDALLEASPPARTAEVARDREKARL
jgi:hypothetical protein